MESEEYYESLMGKEIKYRDKDTGRLCIGKVLSVAKEVKYGVVYLAVGNKWISSNQVVMETKEN